MSKVYIVLITAILTLLAGAGMMAAGSIKSGKDDVKEGAGILIGGGVLAGVGCLMLLVGAVLMASRRKK
jgi:hypothetical protein